MDTLEHEKKAAIAFAESIRLSNCEVVSMDVPDERYMVITVEANMGEPDVGHLPEDERQAVRDLYAGRHRLRVLVVDRKAEIWQWLDDEGQPSMWHYCDTDEPLQDFDELAQRLPPELL